MIFLAMPADWEMRTSFDAATFLASHGQESRHMDPPEPLGNLLTEEAIRANSIADQRLELLVRKHTGQISREVDARLAVLNERLGQLWPRVSPDAIAVLEQVTKDVDDMVQTVNAIQAIFSE